MVVATDRCMAFVIILASMKDLYQILDQIPIIYKKYEHPAVFTCEDADQFCPEIPGGRSKNLFLRNRKGDKHYLLVVSADKHVNLKELSKLVDEVQLSFASENRLMKYLGLTPGSVSPFGLINDENHEVIVLVDNDLMKHSTLGYHPNINTATLVLSLDDFKKFLASMKNEVRFVDV